LSQAVAHGPKDLIGGPWVGDATMPSSHFMVAAVILPGGVAPGWHIADPWGGPPIRPAPAA